MSFWGALRRSAKVDDEKEQLAAIEWLRASVVTNSGPAFMTGDCHCCRLILAYIDRVRPAKEAKMTGDLCLRLIRHAVFEPHTENRRPSEVKEALRFFFTDSEIAEAFAIISGRTCAAIPTDQPSGDA